MAHTHNVEDESVLPSSPGCSLNQFTLNDPSDSEELSVCDVLLSSNVRAVKNILLTNPSGLLITGANRMTRRKLVELVDPSISLVSACELLLDKSSNIQVTQKLTTRTTHERSLYKAISIDDVDFPDPRIETDVKALFTTLGLTHTVIGLAATDASVPPSLRRAGRFDVVYRIAAPSADSRRQAWEGLLKNIQSVTSSPLGPLSGWADELAARSPGYGLCDFAHSLYSCIAPISNVNGLESDSQKFDIHSLLNTVSSHRPINSTADLPFITSGGHSPSAAEKEWGNHGGYESAKRRLIRLAEWPIRYAKTFSRLGIRPPHGVLLHGPGGCGKTLLAQRFVEQLKHANWLYLSADNLFSKYLGESELRVRNLFGRARELTPCVVVLDDIDGVGRGRIDANGDGGSGVESRVLAALLTELDGVQDGDVFVVACAREIASLDPALLRPGRLDEHINIGLPQTEDLEAITRIALDGVPVEGDCLGVETLVSKIGTCTGGLTGAHVFGLCREASMLAIEENPHTAHVPLQLFHRVLSTMPAFEQVVIYDGTDLQESSVELGKAEDREVK